MSTLSVILWENPVVISLRNLSKSVISRISGNSLPLEETRISIKAMFSF
jgi:hypothetical protein